jgi:4-cresol dehydrogenase (hydroxylating)
MLGKPRQVALPLAYWRNPRTEPDKSDLLNPEKDECGLYWYAPLIPMNAQKIKEFVEFIRRTTPKFNIEPLITFTNLKHDCIDSTIPLIFDVKNPQARKDAEACLNTLFEEGRKLGFVPYRMSVNQQKEKLSANIMHWKVVKALKGTLDPNNLLAPNRYNP